VCYRLCRFSRRIRLLNTVTTIAIAGISAIATSVSRQFR
jgi:hypothetical protein